ncbi:MAG: NADH-quinone oxidoreductase subunit M [Chloroflexi bacterium]|nr:NADH-quinone oxidoreductase subunit M [Chloroflexota bacterium]
MTSILLTLALSLLWGGAIVIALLTPQRPLRHIQGLALLLVILAAVAFLVAATGSHGWAIFQTPAEWLPSYHSGLRLRLDPVSLPFALNVLGISVVVLAYAWGYFQGPKRPHLLYALLLAFAGGMLGTCLANDALLFFILWESMLISSCLLLAGWGEGDRVQSVTYSYFVFTQFGSLLILAALTWLIAATGTSNLSIIGERLQTVGPAQRNWLAVAMLLGFGVKLAVVPLHVWLPDAHTVAPMPVTILLAAAMLSMGAYGIVRFPLILFGVEALRPLEPYLLGTALLSQVYGALMCLIVHDIKRIVAYSSVSQMGYVLFGLATLSAEGIAGSIMHVLNHGVLKALLFISVGMVIQSTGRRRIDEIRGLASLLPRLVAILLVAAVAMAGLPPFSAFHSEWLILSGGLESGYPLAGYLAFVTPLLTIGYGLWLGLRLAIGSSATEIQIKPIHPIARWAAYGLLGVSLIEDLLPGPLYHLAQAAADVILKGTGP